MGDHLTVTGDQDFAGADKRYEQAFADYGTDPFLLAPEQGAELLRKLGGEVKMELAAALDDWAYVKHMALRYMAQQERGQLASMTERHISTLLQLTRLLDPDPLRNRVRDAVMSRDGVALTAVADEMNPSLHPAQSVNLVAVHINISERLLNGRERATTLLQKAQPYHPGDFQINHNLSFNLNKLKRFDSAIGYAMAAIAIRPKSAAAWADLTIPFDGLHREDEAIAACRRALELSPDSMVFLHHIASMLEKQGKTDEADAERRKSIEHNPKFAAADFSSRAMEFWERGQIDKAIALCRKSIELDPNDARGHRFLGIILNSRGEQAEAEVVIRKAIALDPTGPGNHYVLAWLLDKREDLAGAAAEYRTTIALDPTDPGNHYALAWTLERREDLAGAAAEYRKAIELDPNYTGARSGLVRGERMAATRDKLPAFLNGGFQPTTNDERQGLAEWCQIQKRYHAAARLIADAIAADPMLADDLKTIDLYDAACYASLAASGQGVDTAKLDDREKSRLRKQALDWLHANLVLRSKQFESGRPDDRAAARKQVGLSRIDSDLASLRDPAALATLPEAERKEWEELWKGVDAFLKQAQGKTP